MKCLARALNTTVEGRSPCGERGLKCLQSAIAGCPHFRRSPCGERGLKYGRWMQHIIFGAESLPVRGAWVEICGKSSKWTKAR